MTNYIQMHLVCLRIHRDIKIKVNRATSVIFIACIWMSTRFTNEKILQIKYQSRSKLCLNLKILLEQLANLNINNAQFNNYFY